jgi:class 3 adenylate cyclase
LTLLVHINELNPILKTVIVSAYGDMDNIRRAMNNGAFDFITKPIDFNDLEATINKTVKYVNELKETLKAIKENSILKMYVDESVLKFMITQHFEEQLLLSEVTNATVCFIDICGFTRIAETQPADKVVNLLNEYFDVIVTEIVDNRGLIDKFIGDAVMAIFRGEDHLTRAINACVTIRRKINKMREANIEGISFYPSVSIGVNSGDMVIGNIGSKSFARLDYTVIGDVVNTAARYQTAASPGQIIIGADLYQKIHDTFTCEAKGEVLLKNKKAPVLVYDVKE